jgi:hypothetical protein
VQGSERAARARVRRDEGRRTVGARHAARLRPRARVAPPICGLLFSGSATLAGRGETRARGSAPRGGGCARVVVDDLGVRLVEAGSQVLLSEREADGVADALAQRA